MDSELESPRKPHSANHVCSYVKMNRRSLLFCFPAFFIGLPVNAKVSAKKIVTFELPFEKRTSLIDASKSFAIKNGLKFLIYRDHNELERNLSFLIYGKGLEITCSNDYYSENERNLFKIYFHSSSLFGATTEKINDVASIFIESIEEIPDVYNVRIN